jgi:two-component system phosphate regulon sensor histidine kinase PhoR
MDSIDPRVRSITGSNPAREKKAARNAFDPLGSLASRSLDRRRPRRHHRSVRFGRYLFAASVFVLLPLVALVVVGVLVLVFSRATVDTTFGVLILSFCVTLLVGSILLVVWLKRAADLSQLQLDFLSKVSHELKTPLTSIHMFTETLAERALTDEQREQCLAMLERETERLNTMIGRLLDFGRMEAGKMEYHRRAEPVAGVVDDALRAFEPIRIRENVELRLHLDGALPSILADREMLSQALLNLLQNAAKYGGTKPVIEVLAEAHDGRVALSVRDHGPGIPRKERRRIFDRFYRIDDRLSRKQEGSGLGLAIVRHVVHAHGGQVRVRNQAEGGAEFSIVLPAAKE